MTLTPIQILITINVIAFGTIITRFLPFIIFRDNKKMPKYIEYLGDILPYSVISLLVIYCLKSVSLTSSPYSLPELLSIITIVALHKWKNSTLLSIAGGTIIYMILVQCIF
ncbi:MULTISPECIES: AzlD domain-containing protein [Clostridium]|uniref:AzlD domain-containing protein n=1 Tax=Clostridium cibarium TaxID=2762247 RepID=A0ABR8PRZ2_9CLOT|nr:MULTISPECIES: AzlD domain-containing protein [Clostridium]MBD7910913.1 AzlD domain-containing protein [Clostridium cibarium]